MPGWMALTKAFGTALKRETTAAATTFGDREGLLTGVAARLKHDAPLVQLPPSYKTSVAGSPMADAKMLSPAAGNHPDARDLDDLIWNGNVKLTREGMVRYQHGGAAGVLEDPVQYLHPTFAANLDGYPSLQRSLSTARPAANTLFDHNSGLLTEIDHGHGYKRY